MFGEEEVLKCLLSMNWSVMDLLVVSLFGVVGLTVPKYDIEFRGFTEFGVLNSVNPFNSLSYPPNSQPATLNRESTNLLEDLEDEHDEELARRVREARETYASGGGYGLEAFIAELELAGDGNAK